MARLPKKRGAEEQGTRSASVYSTVRTSYPPGGHEGAMLQAYYAVLNEEEAFSQALRELYDQLAQIVHEDTDDSSMVRQTHVSDFVARWHLPTGDGRDDVWMSLVTANEGFALRLMAVVRPYRLPRRLTVTVTPEIPERFDYDPLSQGPSWVRARARAIADGVNQSIMQQAKDAERNAKNAGFQPLPPRHRSELQLRESALRLYRRACLRWSWQKIARTEDPSDVKRDFYSTRGISRTEISSTKSDNSAVERVGVAGASLTSV